MATFVQNCYTSIKSKLNGELQGNFQEAGVKWMLNREDPSNDVRGGFLCDDVGMGKTNQMTAVIVGNQLDKPTLVFTLVATVGHWRDTLRNFGNLNTIVLKANFKGTIPASCKVVVAPYSLVQSPGLNTVPSVLRRQWGRIVLDEGHVIRNPKTKVNKMISELKRDIMWILTATPIQNSMNDMLSLAKTIGITSNNAEHIIDNYFLRRRSDEELTLPPLSTHVVRIPFSDPAEQKLYEAVNDIFMERLCAVENNDSKFRNTAIEGIMRLRQVCAHPIVLFDAIKGKKKLNNLRRLQKSGVKRKFIDDSDSDDSTESDSDACTFSQHKPSAYYKHLNELDALEVGLEELVAHLVKRGVDINDHEKIFGSKVNFLISDLLKYHKLNSETQDDTQNNTITKSLVFCSFRSEADVIAKHLDENGISYIPFDGSMDKNDKESAIDNFQSTDVEVMLLQIKCGSTGLNLQAASRVYIMTPNYNPCIDIQAVGRSHRKGQTQAVECIRLVIENTIDDKCLGISNNKLEVITNALKENNYLNKLGGASAMGDLTNADLKALFA